MKAIAHFSNGFGNFVLMMPALQAVASMTEEKKIDIVLPDEWMDYRKEMVEDVCRAWPIVGKVYHYPRERFEESEYGYWFWTAHGASSEAMKVFIRNMKHRPVAKPGWRSSLIHEADHYEAIARAMGYEGQMPEVEFPLDDGVNLDLKRPIIGICNGWFRTEKMYWQKKGWPYFKRLSEVMRLYFGASIVGVGGKDEISKDVELDQDFTGKLRILQSAKVISQLDLIVTTDTGPMHLANILKAPLIALFGPTLTSKNAPRSGNSSALVSGMNCAPCQDSGGFYNCQKFACMEGITVSDVMSIAREKLKGGLK